jgi:hypothetical protein
VTTDPGFRRSASAKECGLHSVFACPILVSREVVGVMEFYAPKMQQPHTMLLDFGVQIGVQLRTSGRTAVRSSTISTAAGGACTKVKNSRQWVPYCPGVAHELNNPLAVVLMHADLLREELGHSPLRELVRRGDAGRRALQAPWCTLSSPWHASTPRSVRQCPSTPWSPIRSNC